MKKIISFLAVAAFVATGVFAQNSLIPEFKVSIGGGGYFASDFAGGYKSESGTDSMPNYGGGGYIFGDFTYAEVMIGVGGEVIDSYHNGAKVDFLSGASATFMDVSALFKWPFALGAEKKLSLFPLLGIDYRMVLSMKSQLGNLQDFTVGQTSDASALWFKFGVGGDYKFTDHVFLRANLLYGVRLPNKHEQTMVNSGATYNVGHGLDIKLAVGYQF
jgi:hypothetical protein